MKFNTNRTWFDAKFATACQNKSKAEARTVVRAYRELAGFSKFMAKPKFITDRTELEKLAPMLKAPIKRQVFVCTGKSCSAVGGQDVMAEFSRILTEKNLRNGKESKGRNPMGEVLLTECGSIGFCSIGTAVMVYPDGTMYGQVTPEDVPEIIEEHLEKGNVVERLALMKL